MQCQIIAEAVGNEQISSEDLETARLQFLHAKCLDDNEALSAFLAKQYWNEEDFNFQLALPIKIKSHCLKHFRHKAEAHFLSRKDQLDQVIYSLLRVRDKNLAQELYLRIDGGEANFEEVASKFSDGPERRTKGIVGPVPMTQAHPIIAEVLRTTKPGLLLYPQNLGDWWVVVRLESYTPAIFNEAMSQKLSRELFDKWVNEELSRIMKDPSLSGVAPTAE